MNWWFDMDGVADSLPMGDRGLQYGDGLFETIAIRSGQPRLWKRHMQRLEASCQRLSLPFPGADSLHELVLAAVNAGEFRQCDATAKLMVTAGQGERGYTRPPVVQPACRVGVFPARPLDRAHYRDGIELLVCETRLAEQPLLAGMKTLNRLEQVLGRMELGEEFEGIMCDAANNVICGTMSNVFIVSDNHISTPALNRCGVEGVTRAEILASARSFDLDIDIRDIALEECLKADEILLANSQFGLLPTRLAGDRVMSNRDTYERFWRLLERAGFNEFGKGDR